MTKEELVAELSKYPGHLDIGVAVLDWAMGASWTGAYCAGTICEPITEINFVAADELAGLEEIDKCDHIEICFRHYVD